MSNTNLRTQTSSVLQNIIVSSCSTSKVQEKTQLSRIKCMNSLRAIQSQLKFLIETLQDFVDVVVIHNTCSEKEESNSETASSKSVKECSLNSKTKDVHGNKIQNVKSKREMHGIFLITSFTPSGSFKRWTRTLLKYTGIEVQNTSIRYTTPTLGNVKKSVAERTRHQRQYDRRVNKRQLQTQESKIDTGKALDADLVDTESIRTDFYRNMRTLKQHYKDLYDSIKITRSKTTEQTTSLHANNAELKAQIQEKGIPSPRSDLRWKPTGRIFKSVGLRWIPTGKLFDSCTSKVDSEPPHGSNVDILNIHECKQTLDVSAGTSINVQKEQSLDLSADLPLEAGTMYGDSLNLPDHSTNSTNGAVNITHGATTASTQAAAVNSITIDNLSDAVICAFFASQLNSPQLDNKDLQQINHDDLEEMDCTDSEYFVFVFELSVRIFRPFRKDIPSIHDSSPELAMLSPFYGVWMHPSLHVYRYGDWLVWCYSSIIIRADPVLPYYYKRHFDVLYYLGHMFRPLDFFYVIHVDLIIGSRCSRGCHDPTYSRAGSRRVPQWCWRFGLERFNKQKPRSFEKAVAPVDAENWISHMEKIFDVMDCNDAFKTRLAVYKFEGDALAWWKAYKQAKGGDAWVNTLTWAAFKELFFLQFFPRAEQERLKREYHSIRQRANENSTEYMQRFLRLAGFLGQVADAARNLEILRDREDYDRSEQSNKRHKSRGLVQPPARPTLLSSFIGQVTRPNIPGSSSAGHDQRNRDTQESVVVLLVLASNMLAMAGLSARGIAR
ncbi:zinc finger, CCHC-type, retrotransposon gag domain protein [Tanacetum coccineum]